MDYTPDGDETSNSSTSEEGDEDEDEETSQVYHALMTCFHQHFVNTD